MMKLIDTLNLKCDIEFKFDSEATTYISPYSPAGVIENPINVNTVDSDAIQPNENQEL